MVTDWDEHRYYLRKLAYHLRELLISDVCKDHGIGLSGGVATGKSVVSELLRKRGYLVVDADELSRRSVELGSPGLTDLVDLFGKKILLADGNLDRDKLRTMISEDDATRSAVNAVIHPYIEEFLWDELDSHQINKTEQLWFYEAALLVETGNYKKYRQLWVCNCQRSTQIHRLMARDKVTRREEQQLIDAQWDNEDKVKVADFVIDSEQSIADIELQIDERLRNMKRESEE